MEADADLDPRLLDFVRGVTSAMGLSFDISIERTGDSLQVRLDGEGGDILTRRKGAALDALQHIVNTRFRRGLADRRIVVDCLNFRKDQDAELRQMVLFLADKAKESGQSQEIGPLNPYSRRIVHLAVAEDPLLASESVGDAFFKTVVISTKSG